MTSLARILAVVSVRTDRDVWTLAAGLALRVHKEQRQRTLVVDLDPDMVPTQWLLTVAESPRGGVEAMLEAWLAGARPSPQSWVVAPQSWRELLLLSGSPRLAATLARLNRPLWMQHTPAEALRDAVHGVEDVGLVVILAPSLHGPWADLAIGAADDVLGVVPSDRWAARDLDALAALRDDARRRGGASLQWGLALWQGDLSNVLALLHNERAAANALGAAFVADMVRQTRPGTHVLQRMPAEPGPADLARLSEQLRAVYDPLVGMVAPVPGGR